MAQNIKYEISIIGPRGTRNFVLIGTVELGYKGTLLFTDVDGYEYYFPKMMTMIIPIKD